MIKYWILPFVILFCSKTILFSQENDALASFLQKNASNSDLNLDSIYLSIKQMPDNNKKAKSLELIGAAFQHRENYQQAYQKLTEAYDLCDSLDMNVEKANIQHVLGLVCFAMRYYEMGIFHQNRFIEFNQKTNNELNEYKGHVALSTLYREIGKYDLAISKLDYVIDNMKPTKGTGTLVFAYYHRGYTAYKLNKIDAAKSDYQKALALSGDSHWLYSFVYNALGDLYKDINTDTSSIYYQKAIEYNKQKENKIQYVHSLLGIGDCFIVQKQPNRAIPFYNDALAISQENKFNQHSVEAANHLRQIYTNQGNWQKGNDFANIETAALKTLLSYRVEQSLLIDSEILMGKQLEHIKYVESKNKLSKLRNQLLISVLILFAVLILFVGLTIRNLRKRNKSESEKNDELELLTTKLQDSYQSLESVNNQLEVSNNDLNNFAALAAHDLKAPLRTIGSFVKIIERRGKDKFSSNDKEMFKFVINSSSKMSQMIDDILLFSKIDKNLKAPKTVAIEDIFDLVHHNLTAIVNEKEALIKKEIPLYTVNGHFNLLNQLFQNLINNALKFVKEGEKPIITVSAQKFDDNFIQYNIADNGIGIEPKNLDTIFELFNKLNSESKFQGNGIGLATCKKIVDYYNGKIWASSEVGIGTTFHFTLPIAKNEN